MMKKKLLSTFFIIIVVSNSLLGSPIKIMPVGNSITAGEHYGKPANAERTGYRKDLYEMLINAGYDVDFVGTQTHGIRSEDAEDWYDWNNEAYPGWQIREIAKKVEISLEINKPDILLVHVGTNGSDWSAKPGYVSDMLDMINNYSVKSNRNMIVFLCSIINRFKGGHAATTQFNNAVADSVAARAGDKIKIIWVDMENGAGLDYSDDPPDSTANPPYEGGDMWGEKYSGVPNDLYHPNDKGNTKMAVKFYEELIKELGDPAVILADYSFEGDANDATGNFNGTLEGDAAIVYNTGRGNVLSLKENGYMSIPSTLADSLDSFSFAGWINFAGTNPWAGLMGMGMSAASTNPYWDFHIRDDGTISFYASKDVVWPSDGCSKVVDGYTLPTNEWTHIAFSFSQNDTAIVYINGVAQATKNWNDLQEFDVTPKSIGAEVVNIGKDAFNQTTLTNTMIDDFKFYKTAINELNVSTIYNSEKIPTAAKIAHWKLDGDASDVFGKSDGTLHNIDDSLFVMRGLQLTGGALDFGSGTDSSYVEVPDNVLIDFDSTTSFTISCLVKSEDFSPTMDVIFKGATNSEGANKKGHWYSVAFKNGELRIAVDDDVNKSQLEFPNASSKMYTRKDWSHIVAMRDREQDSLRLFMNGEQVASMEDITEGDIRTTHLPLIIGNGQNHNTKFNGLLDDIQLFNYALNADELKALFDSYHIRIISGVEEKPANQPMNYSLKQNYPNPFNPTTRIEFQLGKAGHTTITIYNSMGQLVTTALNKKLETGSHDITVRLDNYSSGLYFYKIKSDKFSQTKKMLLLK